MTVPNMMVKTERMLDYQVGLIVVPITMVTVPMHRRWSNYRVSMLRAINTSVSDSTLWP